MKDTEELISQLREFFNNSEISEYEKAKAWAILTALRGPDDEPYTSHEFKKHATTAVIRRKVLGAESPVEELADIRPDSEEFVAVRKNMMKWSHFQEHMMQAFKALGLLWEEVNKGL